MIAKRHRLSKGTRLLGRGQESRSKPEVSKSFPLQASRNIGWILLGALIVNLLILWLFRDLPLYKVQVSQFRPEPTVNFFTEFVPAVEKENKVIQPAQTQYQVSSKLVEAPAPSTPAPPVEVPSSSPALPSVSSSSASTNNDTANGQPTSQQVSGVNHPGEISIFNLTVPTQKIVYLVDFSGSMWRKIGAKTRFEVARDEVSQSVRGLPLQTQFGIVMYSDRPVVFQTVLVSASDENKNAAQAFLQNVPDQAGTTDLLAGLGSALELKPDSIFLITDGGFNLPEWKVLQGVTEMQKRSGLPARLYAVGMVDMSDTGGAQLLRKLTRMNGGTFVPYLSWSGHAN